MKKVTNSKNKAKISKLFPIMQEHLGKSMNLARIKLMTLLLEALVKAQTVNLVRLSNAMPPQWTRSLTCAGCKDSSHAMCSTST